jgi:hypothetical protein
MRKGTLERGLDAIGPELYVNTDDGISYPVAVENPNEVVYLRTLVGRTVKFTPTFVGTRTNPETKKMEAVLFATNIELYSTFGPTINGQVA